MLNMLAKVRQLVRQLSGTVVAFSGGVDSLVLARVAREELGRAGCLAVTATGPIYSARDLDDAREAARLWDLEHLEISLDQLENPAFVPNDRGRCLVCKRGLFRRLRDLAHEFGMRTLVDGTNADDIKSVRPGLTAAQEFAVRSPLLEAGITKADVRRIARELGVAAADKPSQSCYCTRIPYGDPVNERKIEQIARAEEVLRQAGFPHVRVRHHGLLARIEVPVTDLPPLATGPVRELVVKELRQLGFSFVTLDAAGYRSGCYD